MELTDFLHTGANSVKLKVWVGIVKMGGAIYLMRLNVVCSVLSQE